MIYFFDWYIKVIAYQIDWRVCMWLKEGFQL